MAKKLSPEELVEFKELLIGKLYPGGRSRTAINRKSFITEQEFFAKLKQVQTQYQRRKSE